jgi:hypothetical protein
MAAPSCLRCGDRRWVRYYSETKDGAFEEAFRLCPCNYKPEEGWGEDRREDPKRARNIAREKPSRRSIGVIKPRVELW